MSRLFRWLKMDITINYPGTNENRARKGINRKRDLLSVSFLSLFLNIGYDALPLFTGICHCKKCSRGRLPKCNQDVSVFSEQSFNVLEFHIPTIFVHFFPVICLLKNCFLFSTQRILVFIYWLYPSLHDLLLSLSLSLSLIIDYSRE